MRLKKRVKHDKCIPKLMPNAITVIPRTECRCENRDPNPKTMDIFEECNDYSNELLITF